MKYIYTALVSLFLLCPLAGCGDGHDEDQTGTEQPGQQPEDPNEEPEKPDSVAEKPLTTDDIADFDRFYLPRSYNEGFADGLKGMLTKDAQWSFYRCRQSDHFIVFWEPGFGDDPGSLRVNWNLRVNVDDLLKRAEEFYLTNVERLKMVTVGEGKSRLDDYKIQIYLKYQTEWLATGAGYDNRVGALWISPSTCRPAGSTIAHEIGHAFQYLVYCDHLKQGEYANQHSGFRYGFGPNGSGSCGFWEQCAQWQAWQDFPNGAFDNVYINVWLANYHRHFCHEYMRYSSYWLQFYWAWKHGLTVVSRIWQESEYPEDPLETYMRLFCDGSVSQFYDELYDYAARMATYDIDGIRDYATVLSRNYHTTLYRRDDGYWQVAYANCPGTTGFNLIRLTPEEGATEVSVSFQGLATGSPLHADDPGATVDADGNKVGKVTCYNDAGGTTAAGWRWGLVAIGTDGKATYGPMNSNKNGTATWTVPSGTEYLYLVVLATPEDYHRLPWDDDETTDEQWPYCISIMGATVSFS